MSISIGRGGISLSGGRGGYTWVPEFDLWDDFTTAEAAPLASPRTAEPGPGTLTLVQTDGQFSISGGKLAFPAQTTPVVGDLTFYGGSLARAAGRALVASVRFSSLAAGSTIGLSTGAYAYYPTYGFSYTTADVSAYPGGVVAAALATATDYMVAAIMRGTGAWVFIKGGIYTDWTLLYVAATGTGALYPGFGNYNNVGTLSTFRVLDLPAPFNTDYGLATNRIAGAVSAGATFVHEANCLIEFVLTTIGSAGFAYIDYRKQDDNNCWRIRWNSSGTLALIERVAGVDTERGSATSVLSNGHRVVVIADGTTIRVYSNNVLRITYASATNFATETDGELEALGTGGAVSDIVAWPRTLTGQAKTLLDAAIDA